MSNIEWTDETWNPVVGCTPVSSGCLNCYAAPMAMRLEKMRPEVYGPKVFPATMGTPYDSGEPERTVRIAEVRGGRAVFTGDVRLVREALTKPIGWKKPRRVFVNSMSDLFHPAVPFEYIDQVFAVMAICQHHTFQVLTKRPERMAEYLDSRDRYGGEHCDKVWNAKVRIQGKPVGPMGWPLPNVWLGTSVEDQKAADERIPWLLKCPAAVRFLSCEPLLGPLCVNSDLGGTLWMGGQRGCGGTHFGIGTPECPKTRHHHHDSRCKPGLDWVIVGGESGPHSRPCCPVWIRGVVNQCKAAGVPVFVKQLGRHVVIRNDSLSEWPRDGDGLVIDAQSPDRFQGDPVRVRLIDPKGGDMAEWPEDLRVREWPAVGAAKGGG